MILFRDSDQTLLILDDFHVSRRMDDFSVSRRMDDFRVSRRMGDFRVSRLEKNIFFCFIFQLQN